MRDPDWDAKTHIVNVRAHLAAPDAGPTSGAPAAGSDASSGPSPEDGFSDVVTVMAIGSGFGERGPRRAPRGNAANERVLLPMRPTFAARARSALGFFGARVREEYGNARPSMRAALFALPVLAWLVFAGEPPRDGAPAERRESAVPAPAPSPARSGAPAPVVPIAAAGTGLGNDVAHRPPALPGNTRSLEARAADAAAQGLYDDALHLYEELASTRQHRAEFAAVVRILRQRRAARVAGTSR